MEEFQYDVYRGKLIQGKLKEAAAYLSAFSGQKQLYERYIALFENEQYITYDIEEKLNRILLCYQKYIRNVLYCDMDESRAEQILLEQLKNEIPVNNSVNLQEMDEIAVPEVFRTYGYQCMGGQTGRWYGPYVWKYTELTSFDVEVPSGTRQYSIRFMDGFVFRSWLDYISFGKIGTGGWSGEDGVISCVRSVYDLDSESFTVSLLKHEAQHEDDKARYQNMTSEQLEYRAKLVELIYSTQRNLLPSFLLEADESDSDNGHAMASYRIRQGFEKYSENLQVLTIPEIQAIAKTLFDTDTEQLELQSREKKHAENQN